MYPVYYAYWDEYNYADTLITKDYSATVKDAGVAEDATAKVVMATVLATEVIGESPLII